MKDPPELSVTEWDLVLELLERERRDLPSEIHHTDASDMRDQLRERLRSVQQLTQRLRAARGD